MRPKQWAALVMVVLIAVAGPGAIAAETVYHEEASEFNSASRSTNLQVQGSGDEAKLVYTPPDLRETTSAEFSNGTLTNVSVEGDAVAYAGVAVSGQHSTDTELGNAKTLSNLSVSGSGESAVVETTGQNMIEGFEDGDLSEWSNTGGVSIVSSPVYEGSYAMREDSGDSTSDAYRSIPNHAYDSISFAHRVSAFSSPHVTFQQGTTIGPRFRVNSNGELQAYDGSAWVGLGISISTGQWYDIKLKNIDYSNNQFDVVVRYPNGTIKGSYTDAPMEGSISAIDRISVKDFNSNVMYVDSYQNGSAASSAQYISANVTGNRATKAAANLTTLSNMSATFRAEAWTGSAWTSLNKTSVSTTGNTTLTFDTSYNKFRANVTFDKTGSNPSAALADDTILHLQTGEYQSQDHRAPEASAAWADLTLPETSNATVIVEGYDGSSWNILANTKYTAGGNKSLSIGSGYEQYRTTVRFNRSADGATAELLDLGYEATKTGEYTGTNFTSIENATDVFVAANISNVDVTLITQGYNSSTGSWEQLNKTTLTSSTFDDINLSSNTHSTYRVKYSVVQNGSSPTAKVSAIGLIAGGSVVKQVTETTADSTPFLLALSDSANTTAEVTISEIPIGALGDYAEAQAKRVLKEILGFEEATSAPSEANQTQQFYNDHSSAFTEYINNQIAGDEVALKNYDTIAITWKLNNESKTKYWLGLRDGGEFATTTIENSTTREVDETLVLSGYAAVRSEEELKSAHESFVKPGKAPTAGYQATMKAQYGPDISGTLLNESTA